MPSYTINSTSTVNGSTQSITHVSSIEDIEQKTAQEDFIANVISLLQSQKFTDIMIPTGDAESRPYLFYDPTPSPPSQPELDDWTDFVTDGGAIVIVEDDQTRFDTIMAETFALGKKFILALKSAAVNGTNKSISFTSRFNYSCDITVGV